MIAFLCIVVKHQHVMNFPVQLTICENQIRVPPMKLNKLVQYEISSSAVQANSSHAWVHKCMVTQKKRKESACLAFELISFGVGLFSFIGGSKDAKDFNH